MQRYFNFTECGYSKHSVPTQNFKDTVEDDCLLGCVVWKAKAKAVPLHAMEVLVGRGCIAPTHSRPWHQMGVSGQCHAPAVL
jgi:hypothetical protein